MPSWATVQATFDSVEKRRALGEGAVGADVVGASGGDLGSATDEVAAVEASSGDTASLVSALAITGSGGAEEESLGKHARAPLLLEESDASPRSDCRAPERRRGTGAASTAATTTRTASTSPSPSASSSSRASASVLDGPQDFSQQPLEGREEQGAGDAPCGQASCEQGDVEETGEPCADVPAERVSEEAPPGPLFEGTWQDEEGDLVRVQGTTLHGPDGDLNIAPIDERSFTLETGLEAFKATLDDDGRLVWGDGSVWSRKEQPAAGDGEEAIQQDASAPASGDAAPKAEEKPPEQQLGTKARWAFVTKDLHLFLHGVPPPSTPASSSEALDDAAAPAEAVRASEALHAEAPAGEASVAEAPAIEAPPAGAAPADASPAEAAPADFSPAEAAPADASPAEAVAAEAAPLEAAPAKAAPAPAEAPPADASPAEAPPGEAPLPEAALAEEPLAEAAPPAEVPQVREAAAGDVTETPATCDAKAPPLNGKRREADAPPRKAGEEEQAMWQRAVQLSAAAKKRATEEQAKAAADAERQAAFEEAARLKVAEEVAEKGAEEAAAREAARGEAEEEAAAADDPAVEGPAAQELPQAVGGAEAEASAAPPPPPVAQSPPLLDPPPRRLVELLEPMREKLRGSIEQKLEKYDSSYRYPRPEDTKTATRDGFEEQLRTDALKELRIAMRKEYNYGAIGQVWKVVGGTSTGGIIARVDDEVRSEKTTERLATGALVEELTQKEERMKYRLVSGSGPEMAWITTRVKAGFSGFRDLVVKLPPEAAPVSIAVLGLMAAHIRTQARLDRFCHVLRSVKKQKLNPEQARFLFAVSWSASPELTPRVQRALEEFVVDQDSSQSGSTGTTMFAVQQVERHSQFQHLKAALALAEERLRERWAAEPEDERQRSVWVLFGDDDDIWHSCRVAEYVGAIRAHQMLDSVGVFITTARANCSQHKRLVDKDMPVTEEQVDSFLKSGQGVRMDKKEETAKWKTQLRSGGPQGNCQPVPVDLGLEYFDLCPRLRLVHEFFGKTSADFLTHKYCDLTFNEFLTAYPLQGREMGLEVSFFFPGCWMLFYATPIPDEKAWKGSVEKGTDANNGHMSSVYSIEPVECELARRSLADFQEFEAITEDKLARYWAAYRAQLECYLVRKRGYKVDQRIFDCIVFLAMNGSFFDFWDSVKRRAKFKQEAAYEMMCYISQGFAKTIAADLLVDVLWLRPHLFLEPEMENNGRDFHHPGHGYGHGWCPPGTPYGYGKGPVFGKYPPFSGPWGFGKGVGKGVLGKGPPGAGPVGLNKPFGKGAAATGSTFGHSPVFFSPYSNQKPSPMHKKL